MAMGRTNHAAHKAVSLNKSQCFYINLPIGGLAAIITFLFFKPPSSAKPAQATLRETLLQLDLVGAALMMGLLISYILALQYGGQTHPWSSSIVIGLLVGFVTISAAFILWEMYQQEYAMIVPRLVSHTSTYTFTSDANFATSSRSATSGQAQSIKSSSAVPTSLHFITYLSTFRVSMAPVQ